MTTILQDIKNIGQRMVQEQASLRESILELEKVQVTDSELPEGINRAIYNHALNQTKTIELFGITKATFKKRLQEAIDNDITHEPIDFYKKKLFTLHQIQALMDYWGWPKYSEKYNSKTVSILNQKGGTGKTSSCITLGAKAALDHDLNARVCVLDLDPQGTLGRGIINAGSDDVYLTAVDLMLYQDEPNGDVAQAMSDNNMSYEEAVLNTPFTTHLPRLDVVVAFPTDSRFNKIFHKKEDEEQKELISRLSTDIIPVLKKKYDLILIDLPPTDDSAQSYASLEASEALLVPMTPRTYDFASTANFMLTLPEILKKLPSQGNKLEWFKMLAVNHKTDSKSERRTYDKLVQCARARSLPSHIAHSEAFVVAAEHQRTALDIALSEEICSATQLNVALTSIQTVYDVFIREIQQIAAK